MPADQATALRLLERPAQLTARQRRPAAPPQRAPSWLRRWLSRLLPG